MECVKKKVENNKTFYVLGFFLRFVFFCLLTFKLSSPLTISIVDMFNWQSKDLRREGSLDGRSVPL